MLWRCYRNTLEMFGSMHLNLVISCYRNGWWSRVEMKEEAFWHSRSSHQWLVGGGAMPGGGAFVFVFLYFFCICICISWQLYFHLLHFLNLYFWHSLTLPSGVYVLVSMHFLFRGADLVSSGRGGVLLSGSPIHLLLFLKSDWCPGWVTSAKREWGCGRLWLLESPM